jgi:hypothetical protein
LAILIQKSGSAAMWARALSSGIVAIPNGQSSRPDTVDGAVFRLFHPANLPARAHKAWPGSAAAGATASATASLDRVSTRDRRFMIWQTGSGCLPLSPALAVNPKAYN